MHFDIQLNTSLKCSY